MKKIFACTLSLTLLGCVSHDNDDLKQWMHDSSKNLRGQIEPMPQVQPYAPFSYQAFNMLDPFNQQKLLVAKRQLGANAPDFKRPREALEEYDLDKLKMVGTLKRGNMNFGLIKTPDNAVYRVQLGNFVGPNFGRVKRITETEIELSETVEDLNGEWVQRATSMYLDEQGQKP